MTLALTLAVALLTGAGVYLLLSRRMFLSILGFSLLAHAAHLVVLASGGWADKAPIVVPDTDRQLLADPVPQAFVLTAIVISMTVSVYLLAVFVTSSRQAGNDLVVSPFPNDAERDADEVAAELQGLGDKDQAGNQGHGGNTA